MLQAYLLTDDVTTSLYSASSRLKLLCYLEQEVSEGDKRRSVLRFRAPALQHDVVYILRTVVWFAQPLGLHVHLVEDLQTDTYITEH